MNHQQLCGTQLHLGFSSSLCGWCPVGLLLNTGEEIELKTQYLGDLFKGYGFFLNRGECGNVQYVGVYVLVYMDLCVNWSLVDLT